jgi:hypothetical protein
MKRKERRGLGGGRGGNKLNDFLSDFAMLKLSKTTSV